MRYEEYISCPEATWFNTVPDSWRATKMRELFSERNTKVSDKEYPALSVGKMGVVPQLDTAVKTDNGDNRKLICKGDFAINSRSDRKGAGGMSKYDGSASLIITVLKPHHELNTDFYHYLLRSHYFSEEFYRNGKGLVSDLWTTKWEEMRNIYIPVPPREEQDQIVQYLDWKVSKINRIIKNKQKQLCLVREYLDSEFRNIINSECKTVKLKRIVELEQEIITPQKDETYRKAGMFNRGRGIFLRDECPGDELGDSKFQIIHAGRLMLSGQFAWEDAVYITEEKDEKGIASHRYYLLNPTEDIPVEYLFAYFLSDEGIVRLNQCSHGSAGRNRPLNINEVLNLYIPTPKDITAYDKIVKVVRDYMQMQLLQKEKEALLNEYRTRLISDVVTGQIDVRGIEIPAFEPENNFEADAENESDESDDTMGEEEESDA